MPDSPLHHRRSIRLPGYDYSQPGEYFITICTYERQCSFGEIIGGEMKLNSLGQIVYAEWFKTAQLRPYVELYLEEFVVMPNHIHGILHINESDQPVNTNTNSVGALRCNALTPPNDQHVQMNPPLPHSLSAIIRAYKSAVTYTINAQNHTPGIPVWQRNYYEHIIQTEKEYISIENYIENNPANWYKDQLWMKNP
jgi:REP element-mobilizing transposase RayT